MARVSSHRVSIASVRVQDFYRSEFLRHRECLALQRESFSERAITDADEALARVMGRLEEICQRDGGDQVITQILQKFNAVTGLSGWADPKQLH